MPSIVFNCLPLILTFIKMDSQTDVKDRLRESYNTMATEYNTWTQRHNHFRLEYLSHLFSLSPKLSSPESDEKLHILELGCGSGDPFLSTLLARAPTAHVHANDLSDTQLDLARAHLASYADRTTFLPGDMTKLSFDAGSLTAVAALYSLIHLSQDEQTSMLKKISTWLAPGGCLLATFSVEETAGATNESWLHEKGWMFWSGLGKEKTLEAIQGAGLSVVKAEVEGDEEEKLLWIIAQKPSTDAATS